MPDLGHVTDLRHTGTGIGTGKPACRASLPGLAMGASAFSLCAAVPPDFPLANLFQ